MKAGIRRIARVILAIALSIAIGMSFMPICGSAVCAVDETSQSTTAESVKPPKFEKGGRVSGFKVSAKTYNSVTLAWNKYPAAQGYEILKATKKSGKYKRIKRTSYTSYKRTKLTTNSTCYYKVRAYVRKSKKYVYCKNSVIVAGKPELQKPVVKIASSPDTIVLKWGAISGAKGYQVYRATSKSGKYSRVKTTSAKSYTSASISKGKVYYYKVRAYRKVNRKQKNGAFCAITPASTLPATVGNVEAQAAETEGINLTWDEVPLASGYEVYRAAGSESGSYENIGNAETNSFTDTTGVNLEKYYYKVRAYRTLGSQKLRGDFSPMGPDRSKVVSAAYRWLGCKESNKSNKPIIDIYNKNMGTGFNYTTPWCAIFVSTVAIETKYTDYIIRGSYCPSILEQYKKGKKNRYGYGKGGAYKPAPGDVIFFDWNKNNVPDHTGMVVSVDGENVRTIEGNYNIGNSDAVATRSFKIGWNEVMGYGLPAYKSASGIVYTKTEELIGDPELADDGFMAEPEGLSELGSEYDRAESAVVSDVKAQNPSEYDKMLCMIEMAQKYERAESADCSESQYYAAFIKELCDAESIEASVVTVTDDKGLAESWVEVMLDGNWYRVDASQPDCTPDKFVHEVTDIEE